jgi:hypothetical protein
MHWASHGETAAETVYKRVNSSKEHMGLTNFKGEIPSKKEAQKLIKVIPSARFFE